MRCWALRLSFRLACFFRSVACVRAEWRACVALLDAERLRVSCCCFLMCGMDATDNRIGEAGAVALAKALESGQCQLQSLDLAGESMCLAACAAGRCAFRSGWHAFGRWCACVRSGGRGRRFRMLTDCGCRAVFDVWLGCARQRHRRRRCSGACQGTRERAVPAARARCRR